MQQRRPGQVQAGRPRQESYPAPIADTPALWPNGGGIVPNEGMARNGSAGRGEPEGVYIISVAARLLEMHPQTSAQVRAPGLD